MDAFLSEAECLGSGYLPWEGGAGTQEVPGCLLLRQPVERALPISPGGEFHPVALSRQREQEPERGKAANPGISHTANAVCGSKLAQQQDASGALGYSMVSHVETPSSQSQ